MIIDCISDLHGYYPKLEGGDLLIVAGDLTARDTSDEHIDFIEWLEIQDYQKKIVIAGNHDNNIDPDGIETYCWNSSYLEDSGTKFDGLKIWGSPWSLTFDGINPKCEAFTGDEEFLKRKFDLIPVDIDILITHSPPYGIMDKGLHLHLGSHELRNIVLDACRLPRMKLHVFGHIHECGGKKINTPLCSFVNASHVDEKYRPVNEPVRIIL